MFNHVLRAAMPRLTNPLFAYYTRRLRLSRIAWQSWLIFLLGAGLGIGLGVFVITTPRFLRYGYDLSGQVASWLFYPALLLLLVSDAVYAFTALGAAHQLRVRQGQLDELRLSDVEEHGIVAATFAAWQLRVWRFVALECALRVALVAFNFTFFVSPENRMFSYSGIQLAFNITGFVVITITYAFEPLWRMRVLGSTALLWGVRLNNPVLAGVFTFAAALASHGIAFGAFVYIVFVIISFAWNFSPQLDHILGMVIFVWLIPRFSHFWLTQLSLQALVRFLKRVRR